MDFLLLYHFRKLKGGATEILLVLVENITTNMIFEILSFKNLSPIEKYLAMATLVSQTFSVKSMLFRETDVIFTEIFQNSFLLSADDSDE